MSTIDTVIVSVYTMDAPGMLTAGYNASGMLTAGYNAPGMLTAGYNAPGMLTAGYLKDAMATIFFALSLVYLAIYRSIPFQAVFFIVLTGFLVDATFSANPAYHNEPVDPDRPATQVLIALPVMVAIIIYAFRSSLFTTTTPK
jgi:hypothetical protein